MQMITGQAQKLCKSKQATNLDTASQTKYNTTYTISA